MTNAFSPEVLAALQARGLAPPTPASAPTAPQGAPPPGSPDTATLAAAMDARNANADAAMAQMTPQQRQASFAASAPGALGALNAVTGPTTAPQSAPSPSAPGVFATPAPGADDATKTLDLSKYASPGAGGIVPAHEGTTVTATTERMFDAAQRQQQQAVALGQEADATANDAAAQASMHMAGVLAAQQSDAEAAERRRASAYDAQQADYDRIRHEADEGTIKPKDVGLMGTIGSALGAWGASLAGTRNFAQDAINAKIDRDLQAQKENLANKRAAVGDAARGLAEMRDRFGDERAAETAYRARELEQAKAVGDVMVARAGSPMVAAKWSSIKAGLDQQQAQLHNELHPLVQAKAAGIGNPVTAKVLADKSLDLYKSNYGKPGNTLEGAQRAVVRAYTGKDPTPGAPEPTIKPGGSGDARGAIRVAQLDAKADKLQRLDALLERGSSLSLDDRAQAQQLAKDSEIPGLGDSPLDFTALTSRARVRAALLSVRHARSEMRSEIGGDAEPDEDDSDVQTVK